ncbi:MFS transporter [Nocardia zapadnayensis]|uniref:MFS transporter n=1 Tax=Nocardia rhamnosiphila TaxID=426716 RepID=UPI00224742DA|nr:MFS transporter [Nocardia zapadnayensis]MCX0271573.1 MFS transporter [Nocardia zapadnayensis]
MRLDPGGPAASSVMPVRAAAVLVVVCAAQFMVVLDISVVNVALPSIRWSLNLGEVGLGWVVNAYTLVFAGLLLLGGRLADLFGRRRMLLAGLGLFTTASLAGGLADTGAWLIGARAVQGLGAAALAPATLAILTATFAEGPGRTRALAVWTALGMAGGTAGNLLGGALTEWWSWRATLLINVPIGVVAVVAALRVITADRPTIRPRLDVVGAVLVTGGIAALAYGVGEAAARGWTAAPTVAGISMGVFLLAGFALVETKSVRAPLFPVRLLRIRSVTAGNLILLLAGACLNPMWFFLTLSMQAGLGYDPLQTGLAFLPHTLTAIVVGVWVTPWLMRFVEGRVLIAVGAMVAAAGFAWQAQLHSGSGYVAGILGPAVVFSVGAGLLNTPVTAAVTSGVPREDAGAAGGLMNTTKQVGAALGLAVLITVAAPGTLEGYNRAFAAIAVAMVVAAAAAVLLPAHRDSTEAGR